MAIIRAPFTDEQIEALKTFQMADYMHPFTCENNHSTPYVKFDNRLVPTREGWICPHCAYTQDWAHDWMLETWAAAPAVSSDEIDTAIAEFERVVEADARDWRRWSGEDPRVAWGLAMQAALTIHKRMIVTKMCQK